MKKNENILCSLVPATKFDVFEKKFCFALKN